MPEQDPSVQRMRPRPHYRQHRRPKQRSPFLVLPREIRDVIYRHALVRDQAIDLCPNEFLTPKDPDPLPAGQLAHAQNGCPLARRPEETARIRLQKDLVYVRTQMAPCLLATCAQVHAETADYFWGGNTFRFSDDNEWFVFLRFLLTIGAAARTRLRRVEVFAPIEQEYRSGDPAVDDGSVSSKNRPKLHMLKMNDGERGKDWRWRFDLDRCRADVCDLLVHDGSKLKNMHLNLIVPEGHAIGKSASYEQGRLWRSLCSDWSNSAVCPCTTVQDLEFIKITFVIEARAVLWNAPRMVEEITRQGWELVCLARSGMVSQSEEGARSLSCRFGTTSIWEALPRPSLDRPLLLDRLFDDTD